MSATVLTHCTCWLRCSTACIAGGITGLRGGFGGIPARWRDQLPGHALYRPLLDKLLASSAGETSLGHG